MPADHHGTQDRILGTGVFGLPDLIRQYSVRPLEQKDKKPEKILIYTTFAKFHLYMSNVCFLLSNVKIYVLTLVTAGVGVRGNPDRGH